MDSPMVVPVFLKTNQEGEVIVDGPANIADTVKAGASKVVANLAIDGETLNQCLKSAIALMTYAHSKLSEDGHVRVSSLGVELGISSTGKIGFMGTGIDLELAATLQLTLEIL